MEKQLPVEDSCICLNKICQESCNLEQGLCRSSFNAHKTGAAIPELGVIYPSLWCTELGSGTKGESAGAARAGLEWLQKFLALFRGMGIWKSIWMSGEFRRFPGEQVQREGALSSTGTGGRKQRIPIPWWEAASPVTFLAFLHKLERLPAWLSPSSTRLFQTIFSFYRAFLFRNKRKLKNSFWKILLPLHFINLALAVWSFVSCYK